VSAHVLARPRLAVVPVTIGEARCFVEREHSHHHAPVGGLFAVGVEAAGKLCCVAIASRPVARKLDAVGTVAEVTRVASDRTPHAASMCLAAIVRGALALGFRRVVSYTILGESGASYLAAGWHVTGLTPAFADGAGWGTRAGRTVIQPAAKVRWETGPDALPADGAAALACGWGRGAARRAARRDAPVAAGCGVIRALITRERPAVRPWERVAARIARLLATPAHQARLDRRPPGVCAMARGRCR